MDEDMQCSQCCFVSEVDSTPLDLDDLFDVTKELNPVSAKWRNLGIALRLKPNILDGIDTHNNGEPNTCLTSMITEWLKKNYNVEKFGEPTWQWLVEAAGDPAGGANTALAKDIAKKHKTQGVLSPILTISEYTSPPPPSLQTPVVHEVISTPLHISLRAHSGTCLMIFCVAVGVALLLLSVVNKVWKLELDLALYSITAAVGSLTLAVVIQKLWMTQPGTSEKYRKLKCLHHSRLCPETSQKIIDSLDIFSLPQHIQVRVSNYQLLQAIFAIVEGECHTQEMKSEEKFSPIVTIVDTVTQQPLDCVLLLHGEKPPEVSCRTLFCYIAVQVTVARHHDDGHALHPLYHMKSKPCKQGKLPLVFCFHQPGTICVIQLSIHSIVDSEGVEYMWNSEDCTCIVQIIDRKQHQCQLKVQHGAVRIKELQLLRYTGPLSSAKYHKLEKQFTKLYLSPDYEQIQQLSKLVIVSRSISPDIKVFALCWEALSLYVHESYEYPQKLLKSAWKKASKPECENGLLLQGRVLKHLAFMQYVQGNDDKAEEYMSWAKARLSSAAPSNETAFALHTDLLVKSRRLFSEPTGSFSPELCKSTEKEYELLLEHAKYMEEYEKTAICSFLAMKASFHLRSNIITDKLPPKQYWPSPDDLRKAEKCLNSVSLDRMPSKINFYTARYYRSLCDLYIWKQEYRKAMHYLEEARKVHDQVKLNARMQHLVDQRLRLLERLSKK